MKLILFRDPFALTEIDFVFTRPFSLPDLAGALRLRRRTIGDYLETGKTLGVLWRIFKDSKHTYPGIQPTPIQDRYVLNS